MPKVAVYDTEGKAVGEIELSDKVFGVEVNGALLHAAVRRHLANQRQGTADTKTRSEVSGGGRKPRRQKGTGRARQGSIRAPQWRHGGTVFGPTPRSFRLAMPKKARRLALCSALSAKVQDDALVVLEDLKLAGPKTKEVVRVLTNLKVGQDTLIVTNDANPYLYKSSRNLPGVSTSPARGLNAYEVLAHAKVVLTKDAVAELEEAFT